jgi:hypothetical protein
VDWHDPFNFIGLAGASLILLGFYRISIGRWTNKSFWYELDNMAGAGLLIAYQIHNHTYITTILNIVWLIVAFHGLTAFAERYNRKYRRKIKKPKTSR